MSQRRIGKPVTELSRGFCYCTFSYRLNHVTVWMPDLASSAFCLNTWDACTGRQTYRPSMSPISKSHTTTFLCPNFSLSDAFQHTYSIDSDDTDQSHFGEFGIVSTAEAIPQKQSSAHLRRKARRQREKQILGHSPTQKTINRIIHEAKPLYIDSDLNLQSIGHIRGAYTGPNERFSSPSQRQAFKAENVRPRIAADLLAEGYQYIPWTGQPIALLDANYRLFACFTGCPDDPSYNTAANRAFDLVMQLSSSVTPSGAHRRGAFPAINFGLHHGQGLKAPQAIKLNKTAAAVVNTLVSSPDIQRLAHFDSGKPCSFYSAWLNCLQPPFKPGIPTSTVTIARHSIHYTLTSPDSFQSLFLAASFPAALSTLEETSGATLIATATT